MLAGATGAWQGIGVILYRLILSLAFPVLLARFILRGLSGREPWQGLAQRLGRIAVDLPGTGPVIWLHGASNGEVTSARRVIGEILARHPSARLVVTVNTDTARSLATGWACPRVTVALAPLDHRLVVRRFLRRLRPAALVIIENELWPNRLTLCAGSGIPVLVLGARMSAGSARAWARVPGLARKVIATLTWVSAQDAASRDRFVALGLPGDRLGPVMTLKSAPDATAPSKADAVPRAATLLAASTHDGEEALVLAGFAMARRARPDLRLILAPRHPRRRDVIEKAILAQGFARATRSRGDERGDSVVYLADTMGDMPQWYGAAGMTFVGGSLTDRGGHTPFEPAAFGSALLTGPHVANFAPAYAALKAGDAVVTVRGADDLGAALLALADPARQTAMAARATAALAPLAGAQDVTAFLTELEKVLKSASVGN